MAASLFTTSAQGQYREYGSVEKPAILLIHGFPGNATDWDSTARELSNMFRVIVPDLVGFGNRTQKELKFEQLWLDKQTENLLNVIQMTKLDSFSIVAHDFGVPIAVMLTDTLKVRIKNLILTAGNTLSDPPLNPIMKAVPKPIIGGVAKRFLFSKFSINMMRTMGTKKGKVYPTKNTKEERHALKTIFATSLENMHDYFLPIERMAAEIQVRTLIIWGEKDPFFPVSHAERMKTKTKNARLLIYKNIGHYPFIEETIKFATDIKNFISI